MLAEPTKMTEGNNSCTQSHGEPDGDTYETKLFPVIYSLVFIIGSFGNLIAICLTYMYIKQKNILGIYLMNLCISDFLYLLTLPMWIVYTKNHDSWNYGENMCRLIGFVFYTNNYTTIMFLCCIALDRCLAVAFPLRSLGLRRMSVAIAACAFVWALLVLSHIPLVTHPQLFNDSHHHEVCYEKYKEPWVITINYFRVFVGFLVPLCLIVASYSCIIHIVRRTSVVERRQKVKIISLIVAILVIFVVSFLPYNVLLLVRSIKFGENDLDGTLRSAYRLCFTLTSLSSALNPFLNVFVSENFPEDLRNVVTMLTRCLTRSKCCKRLDDEVQQKCDRNKRLDDIQPSTMSTTSNAGGCNVSPSMGQHQGYHLPPLEPVECQHDTNDSKSDIPFIRVDLVACSLATASSGFC
ncbi:G-protein coupled receptor 4-like [Lampetra fluviatilis]